MSERERLVALLYTLMRDHLPTGDLEKAMEHVRAMLIPERTVGPLTIGRFRAPAYSVPELAEYAGRLADEIFSGQMDIRPVPRVGVQQAATSSTPVGAITENLW